MPPKRGHLFKAGGRGSSIRGRTKPRSAGVTRSRKWPQLTKEPLEPVEPRLYNAFLSLKLSRLELCVEERGWPLVSSRARVFFEQKAANEIVLAAKKAREAEEGQSTPSSSRHQDIASSTIVHHNIGFLTLNFSKDAWARSQIPLAQSWRATHAAQTKPAPNTQTEAVEPPHVSPEISPYQPLPTNEPVVPTGPHVGANPTVPLVITDGKSSFSTPQVLEISPITSTIPHTAFPPTPADSESSRKNSLYLDTDEPSAEDPYDMSGKPEVDAGGVDDSIKEVIQNLFVMQTHVASFRPEHQDGLNRKVEDLAMALQKLDEQVTDPTNPIRNIKIAPDIIDYVDDGRNPDIYTRDFVELVQRGNAVMNGKQKAFRNFSKVFAKALKENLDGMDEEVDMVMENAGIEEKNGSFVDKESHGTA